MSLSLYIGSEPPHRVEPSAWNHEMSESQVMKAIHEVIRTIPSFSNEELYIVVGKHGERDSDDFAESAFAAGFAAGIAPDPVIGPVEHTQDPQTERWVRRALFALQNDLNNLESDLGDYPSVEDLEARFAHLENEDGELERRVTDLENRFTDLETP